MQRPHRFLATFTVALTLFALSRPAASLARASAGYNGFEPVEREEEPQVDEKGDGVPLARRAPDSSETPEERGLRRREAEADARRAAVAGLGEGWTSDELDGVLVISHVAPKQNKVAAAHVVAVYAWLDERLPEVGPEEYVRIPILRICASREEARSFREGGAGWTLRDIVITTFWTNDVYEFRNEWEDLNEDVLEIWFRERDPGLWSALPPWIGTGLVEMIGKATVKGRKLRLEPGLEDDDTLRVAKKEERLMTARELLQLTTEKGVVIQSSGLLASDTRRAQLAALVRLVSETKKFQHVLPEFLANLRAALDAGTPEGKPAQEEAFLRTFGDWSESQWKAFERAYAKTLD